MGTFLKEVVTTADGTPLPGAVGLIYSIEDTNNTTPLTPTTLSGTTYFNNEIQANNDGVTPDFIVPGYQTVKWVSGSYEVAMQCADPLPKGGLAGQVLTKNGSSNFDMAWQNPTGIASGGTDGQVLLKDGSTPFATRWGDAPVSSGGTSGGGTTTTVFAAGSVAFVRQDALGNWPVRPTSLDSVLVIWVGVDSWPAIVTSGVNGPHAGDIFIEKRTT